MVRTPVPAKLRQDEEEMEITVTASVTPLAWARAQPCFPFRALCIWIVGTYDIVVLLRYRDSRYRVFTDMTTMS